MHRPNTSMSKDAFQKIPEVKRATAEQPLNKNILLIGSAGSGKTTMACSSWTEGPVHILDLDNKFAQLAPEIIDRWPEAQITYQEFRGTITGNAKIKIVAAPNQKNPADGFDAEMRPRIYQRLLDVLNGYHKIVEEAEHAGEIDPSTALPFRTLVLDSYTRVRDHLRATIRKEQKHSIITQSDWGVILDNDVALIAGLLALPCNVIVICHQTADISKTGIVLRLTPAIQGQFKDTIASHFQEVYFLKAKEIRGVPGKQNNTTTAHMAIGKISDLYSCARSSLIQYKEVPANLGRVFAGEFRGEKGRKWLEKEDDSKLQAGIKPIKPSEVAEGGLPDSEKGDF